MGILYIISVLILLTLFVLVKKNEKQINIVSFICISIITLFCYNTFICYILTFFTIPIKLWFLAIINFIIASLFLIKILKNKQIQKYTLNKVDILYISLIALTVIIISYINFRNPLNIKYETSDPAVHYLTSVMFAESDSLLAGTDNDPVYGSFNVRKAVSYVNSGLLMKSLCKNLDPMECYNIFAFFGMLILFLTGTMLYSTFADLGKKKEHRFWAFILSLTCMLGYPLNSFLFGFEYLSMGLLIICAILGLTYYYEEESFNKKYIIPIIALLNYGLFSSYYMFVSFVYPALGVYFYIKHYKSKKKIISKEIILIWLITLIIPFVLGYIYHLEPSLYAIFINKTFEITKLYILISIIILLGLIYYYIKKHDKTKKLISKKYMISITIIFVILILSYIFIKNPNIYKDICSKILNFGNYADHILNTVFKMDGYIYINMYSNMLLLIPLPIYLIIKRIKKHELKKDYIIMLLLLFVLIFLEVLLIGYNQEKVSIYYLSKNYFALWIILFYYNYKALIELSKTGNYLPRLFIGVYVFLMIFCTSISEVKMVDDSLTNPDENIFSVMEIFGANKTLLLEEPVKLNQDEIDILMYAKNNLDYNSKIEVVTEGIQYYWSYVLLRYVNYEPVLNKVSYGQFKLNLKSYYLENKINKVDYMIYFKRSDKYLELQDKLFINSEIIYENNAGGILKYNK